MSDDAWERPRLVRIADTIFGQDRIDRWLDKLPEPPKPCPWSSAMGEPCIHDAGHPGTCRAGRERTNYRTGKTFTTYTDFYGINYQPPDTSADTH